jgi:hypothetical protein
MSLILAILFTHVSEHVFPMRKRSANSADLSNLKHVHLQNLIYNKNDNDTSARSLLAVE